MTTVVILLGTVALGALVWLANGIWRIGAVSAGEPIGDRAETALLLIDLQDVFWEQGPYSAADKSQAETAILEEIRAAKANGYPVIAVRQEWSLPSTKAVARLTMKGQAIAGTPGTEMANPFADCAEYTVVKRVQDAFETGELGALLSKLNVGRVRLVGLDFNYCVLKTALAARNRGFDVHVVRRGTLAAASTARAEDRLTTQGVVLA